MAGFLGSGVVYANRQIAGVDEGFVKYGNATKFEITENTEIKERISKQIATYGQVLDSVAVKQPAEISITLDDLDQNNLALAFLGDTSAVSVSGSTVSTEAAVGYKGKSFRTAQRAISSLVVKGSGGTPTYTVTTDYILESASLGLVEVVAAGAITDGLALEVDYTYASLTSENIDGGTNASIKVALLLDGVNQADDTNVEVNVLEAVIAPQNGVDFLSDDFASVELNGKMNTPTGETKPYTVELNVV